MMDTTAEVGFALKDEGGGEGKKGRSEARGVTEALE